MTHSANQHAIPYSMVPIPAGEVALRDDRIKRSWTEQVDAFMLAAYPVTNALFASVMPSPLRPKESSPDAPVTDVSWLEAIAFCNALSEREGLAPCYAIGEDGETVVWDRRAGGYRLPTEAEWQYACKAGTSGYRYGELDDIAWYSGNSEGGVRKVGGKKPNDWGLYDMLGNVWEWCWDIYDADVYGSYRVFRGGSWAEEARGCGATCRRRSHPTFRIDDLGFRLART
ncbi:formylglycine-generating enzyme family protein [Paenibacillus methanolicus]|uniref:Formylglycine-generating enzyme required for sulfatase activity n=1 Tax=Paenibacillus methanolicus TaxID=582686 RepID=A0A5S5C7W3_9BACL|nr:SUMF1/EgtB/PvdO family nonheme iron enzyme [Paenibacillus methanolicus]TYP74083.1 formylglycine-generating enzyme required for sulfatase activity [Paenibacillus methanolicus]